MPRESGGGASRDVAVLMTFVTRRRNQRYLKACRRPALEAIFTTIVVVALPRHPSPRTVAKVPSADRATALSLRLYSSHTAAH